jgi:hypothetical protein
VIPTLIANAFYLPRHLLIEKEEGPGSPLQKKRSIAPAEDLH